MFEKPLNYSVLRVFGCESYVGIPEEQITRLDAKSKKCIFLDYANETKGYRLWDPTDRKIIIC